MTVAGAPFRWLRSERRRASRTPVTVPRASGPVTGFRRAVTTSRARSCACSTCAPPRRALVPRARLGACSSELQGGDLPALPDDLEAGGDGAGAGAVAHVEADLGALLGDEAGVQGDQLGADRLDAAGAGPAPDRGRDQVGAAGEVLVDLRTRPAQHLRDGPVPTDDLDHGCADAGGMLL